MPGSASFSAWPWVRLGERLRFRMLTPLRRLRWARLCSQFSVGLRSWGCPPWQQRRRTRLWIAAYFRSEQDRQARQRGELARLAAHDHTRCAAGVWKVVIASSTFALKSPGGSGLLSYLRLASASSWMSNYVAVVWLTKVRALLPTLSTAAWPFERRIDYLHRTCFVMCKRLRRAGPDCSDQTAEASDTSPASI